MEKKIDIEELKSLIVLNSIDFLPPIKIKKLIDKFGSAKNVLSASIGDLIVIDGINEKMAKKILNSKNQISADRELEVTVKNGVKIVTYFDNEYPEALRYLFDPPILLYIKGEFNQKDGFSLSIVGTRKPTSYGKLVVESLIREIKDYKFTIISGLAYGIDTLVHENAIKNNLKTIAVLGNGIGVYYPAVNKTLQEKIPLEGGCLISEFCYFRRPDKLTFPRRNRIIAALSLATIVVEADIKSGALITANFAVEMGKEVFAVPGSIFSKQSRGTNFLIKNGAKILSSFSDIVEELQEFVKENNKFKDIKSESIEEITEEEKKVLDIISSEPEGIHIDKLQYVTNIDINRLLSIIFKLQLLGKIKEIYNKTFISF